MKIGYARISTQEQDTKLQIDALKQAGCDRIYSDIISGKTTSRAGLDECLAVLNEDDTLVVWKLDRLGRSTVHLIMMIDELNSRGIIFHSLTESFDTGSSMGRAMMQMMSVFAELERNQNSDRTKAGMAALKAEGMCFGRGAKGGKPAKVKYDTDFIIRLHYEGRSSREIAKLMPIGKSTVSRIIRALTA